MTMSSESTVVSVNPLSPNRAAGDKGIVAVARDIGPVIAKMSIPRSAIAGWHRQVVDALRAAGLFRLFTPRALGGLRLILSRSRASSRKYPRSTVPRAGRFRSTPVHGGRRACR